MLSGHYFHWKLQAHKHTHTFSLLHFGYLGLIVAISTVFRSNENRSTDSKFELKAVVSVANAPFKCQFN